MIIIIKTMTVIIKNYFDYSNNINVENRYKINYNYRKAILLQWAESRLSHFEDFLRPHPLQPKM